VPLADRSYPSDPAELGRELFLRWAGSHYARSLSVESFEAGESVSSGTLMVGRRWSLAVAVLDAVTVESDYRFEAARAALEKRLDDAGRSVAVWVPRGAPVPADEPALSEFLVSLERAAALDDGRLEVRLPVTIYLRRTGTTGSVVTALGGLAAHWAQFTNKVPGTFQLNSSELHRLPYSEDDRLELANRIVQAAAQPDVDEGLQISAEDSWTVNELGGGRSYVVGTGSPESDESSATLRRHLRKSLKAAESIARARTDARALVVVGASNYATEEKLSWALRGMDPRLYAGFDIITVVTDGLVQVVLEPPRNSLPWDAPLR
jgi:hypothetical protein